MIPRGRIRDRPLPGLPKSDTEGKHADGQLDVGFRGGVMRSVQLGSTLPAMLPEGEAILIVMACENA